jgi:hypothetical protein
MSGQVTESEILAEANEIYIQKRQTSHNMNVIAAETAKMQKVQKSLLNRLKDYYLYKGNGWSANDPLHLDKTALTYDHVSPVFIKLFQIIDDLRAVDSLDFLDEYIAALQTKGIKLYIDPGTQVVSDKDDVLSAVNAMGAFQKQINALDDQIKIEKAEEADNINLTAKSEFSKLVAFYNKKEEGKDIDDSYQEIVADYTLRETGYTKVYDNSLN